MTLGVCITTRHRPELLEECLAHIERSTEKPVRVVVSDDSSKPESIAETERVVSLFARATYVRGPRRGVCANRNNAIKVLTKDPAIDLVAFLDDDAFVEPAYFERALEVLEDLPEERRRKTIVSGVRIDLKGERTVPCKLSFRGYFVRSERTEVAGASYAVYPKEFFARHEWDEQIYFGYEDAELSLRAMHDGYEILHCEKMVMIDAGRDQSSMLEGGDRVDAYNFSGEAARLYVGVKRFKDIEHSLPKLAVFVPLFFAQVSYSLAKRHSLSRLPELVKLSNVASLVRRA